MNLSLLSSCLCWVSVSSILIHFLSFADALLPSESPSNGISRRDLLRWPLGIGGAVVYGKLVSDAAQKLSRGELVYPEAHEQRVASTIATAILNSIPSNNTGETKVMDRPLRVLEVGIGKDCRVIRRNLYRKAYDDVVSSGRVSQLALTGLDISVPPQSAIDTAKNILQNFDRECGTSTQFQFVKGSISEHLNFPDGYFDCIVSSLTLCSVDDQAAALKEMKRLLRGDGGCLGYVEHTAVLPDEPYRFLELQQKVFDPLQQAVADNCHLHRYTDLAISNVFNQACSRIITSERFLVEGMWPVSCQSCGVIQQTF